MRNIGVIFTDPGRSDKQDTVLSIFWGLIRVVMRSPSLAKIAGLNVSAISSKEFDLD